MDKIYKGRIGGEIKNEAPTPQNPTEVANKAYVDSNGGTSQEYTGDFVVTQNLLLSNNHKKNRLFVQAYASIIIPNGLTSTSVDPFKVTVYRDSSKAVSFTAGENVVLDFPPSKLAQIYEQYDAVVLEWKRTTGGIDYYGIYGALVSSEYDLPLTLNVSQTSVESTSLLYPSIYKSSDYPEITTTKDYFMLYSSDHAATGAGCYWGECDDPEGTNFVERGMFWASDETPFLIRIPTAKSGIPEELFIFAHGATTAGIQETKLKVTSGGAPLHQCTFVTKPNPFTLFYGTDPQHTGYAKIYEALDGTYVAHHLTVGDPNPQIGISTSPDGLNWTLVTENANQTPAGVPSGYTLGWRTRVFPFVKNGVQYAIFQYRLPDASEYNIGVAELDANFLPSVFIKKIAEYNAYDGNRYIENDIMYFFVYIDGSDGTGGGDTGNAFLFRYYLPDAI